MKDMSFSQWLEAAVSQNESLKDATAQSVAQPIEQEIVSVVSGMSETNAVSTISTVEKFNYTPNSTFSQWLEFEAQQGRRQLVWGAAVEGWEKIKEKK